MDKSNSQIIKELNEKEIELGFHEIKVDNVPIWRLVRFGYRLRFLKKEKNFTNRTKPLTPNYFHLIKFFVISFLQIFKFILVRNKYNNFIFAFPRLNKIGNSFIDKFTDPIINQSDLKQNYVIFQRSLGGIHNIPRLNSDKVIYTDFIDLSSKILSILLLPVFYLIYISKTKLLLNKISKVYTTERNDKLKIIYNIVSFKISKSIYKPLFRISQPKNIFIVSRSTFASQISVSKHSGAKVYELQHGIAQAETILYTGFYDFNIDPDYFLVFGEAWINSYYGIGQDKIINIGWAYQDFVKKELKDIKQFDDKTFLVVSSPAITQNIINFVLEGIKFDENYKFNIRLHPQERLTEEQSEIIQKHKNISIVDNSIESIFSISSHINVVGDNSSVLYEALSLGKNVGKINMKELKSRNIEEDISFGFKIISCMDDLESFIINKTTANTKSNRAYTFFKEKIFNELIK